jgi:hypothetical protein
VSETFASALTLDIPRARKALEHLIAHPEEHNQLDFGKRTACGTTMCIAGTVVYQDAEAGQRIQWQGKLRSYMVGPGPQSGPSIDCQWVPSTAADLLGLGAEDASELFYEFNNDAALSKLSSWIDAAEKAQAEAS